MPTESALRRVVLIVALLNLAYFGLEFGVALAIQSVSLFADSIDFLEDACVNFLIFFALGWQPQWRAWVGMFLAGLLLVPALATLWSLVQKFTAPLTPDPFSLSLTGLGALVINLICAFWLARFRQQGGSIAKAAFLSARNDALANIAIMGAGLLTAVRPSLWPDVVVGVGILVINLDAAREVYTTARKEL
ncbi:MAG: cation transporter [Gloeomargarita sp. HHBFW_bins_162]